MKVIKQVERKETKRYDNPYGDVAGESPYVDVEETHTYTTVEVNENEYLRLMEVLMLSDKQYKKFKKKFYKR